MPTRVLDLGANIDGDAVLVLGTHGQRGRYITLATGGVSRRDDV